MKPFKIAAILTLVTLLIGVGGFFYWKQTPSYALVQLVRGFENKDKAVFDRYVNLDQVVDHLVNDLIDLALSPPGKNPEKSSDQEGLSAIGQAFLKSMGKGLSELYKPQLKKMAHDEVTHLFTEKKKNSEEVSIKEVPKPEDKPEKLSQAVEVLEKSPRRIRFKSLGRIEKTSQEKAKVSLHFTHEPSGKDWVMILEMHRGPKSWQVVRWLNLNEVIALLKEWESEGSA